MKIELINTGNELLLGTTLNTHGAWIGGELLKIGLRLSRQVTVPDGEVIGNELKRALVENDVVIITGGLGPTSDDVTREETARALGLELMEDEFAVRTIEEFFHSRGREMAECNRKQAMMPCGADVLANPMGTAPGVYVPPRLGDQACAVFLLPGPPSELRPMVGAEVLPRLEAMSAETGGGAMEVMSFCGVGESDFHQALDAELGAIEGLEVGYCARPGDVDLRLIGDGQAISKAKDLVMGVFGGNCYTERGESIEEVVVRLLAERGWSLATAESCTGGAIASRITDVSGSSGVFGQGYVTYSNAAKVDLLGVEEADLEKYGAVSREVAQAMADGAMERAGADIAVAVTGIAGPTGGTEEKPVGTVWMAVAVKGKPTEVWTERHARGRAAFKRVVVQKVLSCVWSIVNSQ